MIGNRPPSAKQLSAVGLLLYAAGFVFAAISGFESGFVRDDALVLGSFALVTSAVLWICQLFGLPTLGNNVVKAVFVGASVFCIYIALSILQSDLPLLVGIPLVIGFAALLYPVWLVTWHATLRVHDGAETQGNVDGGTPASSNEQLSK